MRIRVPFVVVSFVAAVACGSPEPEPEPECTMVRWFVDDDHDGFGSVPRSLCAETAGPGLSQYDGDCNDANPLTNPAALETCAAGDDDCDGAVDEGVGTEFTVDSDGDGYGSAVDRTPILACSARPGLSRWPRDCDDASAGAFPGGIETCNDRDDDCDGEADEPPDLACRNGAVLPCTTRCGSAGTGTCSRCEPPSSEVCSPPTEICNGADDDCDGRSDEGVRSIRALTHDGMAGADHVQVVRIPSGWLVLARLADRSIVAQRVDEGGALGTLVPLLPAASTGWVPFRAATDGTHVFLVWLMGSSYYDPWGTRAPLSTLVAEAPRRLGLGDYNVAPLDIEVCDGRLVIGMRRSSATQITLATTDLMLGAYDPDYASLASGGTAYIQDFDIVASSQGCFLAGTYIQSGVTYAAISHFRVTARSNIDSDGVPRRIEASGAARAAAITIAADRSQVLFAWGTGTGTASFEVLSFRHPSEFAPPSAFEVVASSRMLTDVANLSCALRPAALGDAFLLGWESGNAAASTVEVTELPSSGGMGMRESLDPVPSANGCAEWGGAADDSSALVTVVRSPAPVSFLWGC